MGCRAFAVGAAAAFQARVLATLTTLVFICAPISPPALTAPREEPAVVVDESYRAQILLTDALGLGLFFGAAATNSEEGAWFGMGVLAVGPALVHLSHDRGGEALASFAMRPGLTIGGMFAGAALINDPGCRELCNLVPALLGGVAGYGIAVIVDTVYLAREKRAPRNPSWMPTVSATSSSVQLGVGGRF
jgi:hypothetical protein